MDARPRVRRTPRPGPVPAGLRRPGAAIASTTGDGRAARPAAGQARPLAARDGRSPRPAASPLGGVVTEVRPGAEIRVRAGRAGAPRRVRGRLRRAWPPGAGHRPVRRAAARWDRRRASRQHPRGGLPDRRRGADAGPGDGRARDRRRDAPRQGAARLPGLGAPPAGRPPPGAAVRRPGPRRGGAASDRQARWPRCWSAWPGPRSRCSSIRRRSCSTRSPSSCRPSPPDWVRIRSGVNAGLEGRVIALLGLAPVRGQRAARGGPGRDRGRAAPGRPDRRPGALRLTAGPSGRARAGRAWSGRQATAWGARFGYPRSDVHAAWRRSAS